MRVGLYIIIYKMEEKKWVIEIDKVPIAVAENSIKVFVVTAVRNVNFHFDQKEIVLSTVKSVWQSEDLQEQTIVVLENIGVRITREDLGQHPKMLMFKFWLS